MKIEEIKKLPGDESSRILLRVKENGEEQASFRMNRNTRLIKLMNSYCNMKSIDSNSLMFLFNGYHLQAQQTPLELDMRDGDEIDATTNDSHEFNHNIMPTMFQFESHNDSSLCAGLQSGPGVQNDSGGNDSEAECCSTHLIDGDGTFNEVGLDNFIKKVKLGECGNSYVVVSIMGPQSSGKSTLLNHLFHTNFKEMDAYKGRCQTTKGIWIAKCPGIEPCTIVMDLEGTNGRERGEVDTAFEKQSALFVLAISEIVLINMWCHDIGLEQAAYKAQIKNVFQVMLRVFISRKTSLVFVIRDKTRTPLENLESVLREDIKKIWDSVPKPEAHSYTPLSEFFNIQVAALSSYEDKEEQFKEQVASLRQKFFQSITPGGLAGDRRGVVPASGFSFSAQQIWKVIRENKDLDLPAHKLKVETVLCEEIAREKYSSFVSNKDWLELPEVVQSQHLPGFGEKISSLLYNCLSSYDEEAVYFEDDIRCAKRKQLEKKLMQLVLPAYQLMLETVLPKTLENFKKALNDALNGGLGFEVAAHDCAKEFMRLFDEEYVIKQLFWDLSKVRDKFSCDLDSHIAETRTAKISELSSLYESEIKGALNGPVEVLLKGGRDDTWSVIRNLLHQETARVVSELLCTLSGFAIGEQEKEYIISNLNSYSRELVKGKAKEEAGKVLAYMKERFTCIFKHDDDDYSVPRAWTGKEDIQAISKTAQSSSVSLLSILAVVRLDEETDTVRDTFALALLGPKNGNRKSTTSHDPLASNTWEEVPAAKTLITPVECKLLWNQFQKETEYIITQAINAQIIASSFASQARKRQRHTWESSSQPSKAATTTKAYVPLHSHTWLHFPMTEQSYARLRLLCNQDILPLQMIDWQLMEALDSKDRLMGIFTEQWRRLMDPVRVVYRELTLEFMCSFQFSIPVIDFTHPEVIQFQLGGKEHRMSVADFGIALGLYTDAEIRTPQFKYGMIRTDVSDLQISVWWRHVAGGVLGRATRGRWFRDPLHRYVHKVVAHTVASRGKSTEQVTRTDSFILYCLLNQIPCNIAHLLASYFAKGRKAKSPLGGGAFVTAIAEHLGLIPQHVCNKLTVEAPAGRIDRQTVKLMGLIVELPDDKIQWIEKVPTPEEGDLEYDHDADPASTTPPTFTYAPPPPCSAPPFLTSMDPVTHYLVEGMRWCIGTLQELATHANIHVTPPPVLLQQAAPTQQEDIEDLD